MVRLQVLGNRVSGLLSDSRLLGLDQRAGTLARRGLECLSGAEGDSVQTGRSGSLASYSHLGKERFQLRLAGRAPRSCLRDKRPLRVRHRLAGGEEGDRLLVAVRDGRVLHCPVGRLGASTRGLHAGTGVLQHQCLAGRATIRFAFFVPPTHCTSGSCVLGLSTLIFLSRCTAVACDALVLHSTVLATLKGKIKRLIHRKPPAALI